MNLDEDEDDDTKTIVGWKVRVAGSGSWLWVERLTDAEELMRIEIEEHQNDEGPPLTFTIESSALNPDEIGDFDGWD